VDEATRAQLAKVMAEFMAERPDDPIVRKMMRTLSYARGERIPFVAPTKIRRSVLEKEEWRAWNAYVDMLSHSDYDALNAIQKVAYLAFWYDAEVCNGGHMQYFLNSAGAYAEETIKALPLLGASEHAKVLAEALALVCANPLPAEHGSEIYLTSPLAGPLSQLDRAYGAAQPEITDLLRGYLQIHFDQFIEVVEEDTR